MSRSTDATATPDSDEFPTVLITGATAGIGATAAEVLAGRGWEVLVHGRNATRGDALVTRIRNAGDRATFLQADFADPEGVHDLARAVREHTTGLDALVLNAALSLSTCHEVWDGVEEPFAVNQLAPYLLTHELTDLLEAAAPSRVLVTSSEVHTRGELPFDDSESEDFTSVDSTSDPAGSAPSNDSANAVPSLEYAQLACTDDYNAFDSYARSKFANLCFAVELAERFDGRDVTVNAFHPGFVPGSELYRDAGLVFRTIITLSNLLPFVGTSVDEGAEPIVHLIDDADADITGAYFAGTTRTDPDPRVTDPDRRIRLWNACADLVGVDPNWP